MGMYLGFMFLMVTVLIIYYKQISEGYDDKGRYKIMQQVGMDKQEVKKSIRSQVLMIFFLPLIMAIEYLLSLGFALIVSAGTVFFKDLEHITTVVLMAWIYGTPIMYSLEMIPANIKWLFKVNPMTAVIESYHRILYWKELPLGKDILYSAVFAIVMVIIGELVFAKLDDNFAEEL